MEDVSPADNETRKFRWIEEKRKEEVVGIEAEVGNSVEARLVKEAVGEVSTGMMVPLDPNLWKAQEMSSSV